MTDYKQISIDRFKQITSFELSDYLIRVDSFFTYNYPKINDWYSGNTNKPDITSFKLLNRLLYESSVISELVYTNKSRFDKAYFWELLENLEDISIQLLTTSNLSKFLRSIITKSNFTSALEVDYTMKKYDTLEKIQREKVSFPGYDDDWINIALRNDLSEDQYDIEGGVPLKLPTNFSNIFLSSVVDNMIGDKLYGRDIAKKFTFEDDDLKVLDYKPTVIQSLEILISIRRGSIPEFADLGISEDLVVGSTRSSFVFPIIQRQLNNLFNTDDSFIDFEIQTLQLDQDAVYISFAVNTVRGELFENTIAIQP